MVSLKLSFILALFFTCLNSFLSNVSATERLPLDPSELKEFSQIFKEVKAKEKLRISDPILAADQKKEKGKNVSSSNLNTELFLLFNENKFLGFSRPVDTTTGCSRYCKSLKFTLFFSPQGDYLGLTSTEGLTKKWHEEFTPEDYFRLDRIIKDPPPIFKAASHSTQLVEMDTVSMATRKEYAPHVVKDAALTTFRIYRYVKQTKKYIRDNYQKYLDKVS